MSLAAPFIKRPVATVLVMLGIVVFGLVAYTRLPVSDLPTIDFPTISVQASLPGASPETMASAVATPLEKQFSTIAGIDAITSVSNLGRTSITLQFTLDRDIDAAAQDVQSAMSQAIRDLPPGMIPPSARKVNPAAQAILYFALTSDQLPMPELNEYGETMMAQRLSMVPGVAQVQIYGSQKYAVRIQVDPMKLAYQKIGIDEVAGAVASQNVNMPTGVLWGPSTAYTLRATGQLDNAAGFRELVVTYRNGVPVKLGDIAHVLDDVENNRIASWYNGQRGMILGVQRQPGTNTVAVAGAVNALVDQMRAQFPPSVKLETLYDRSVSIQESVHEVKFTLLLTIALVVLVIFLFLRNLSATVIPSLALPVSLIGTFAVMYALGHSLDNLSLMALTLAVGFVVDDAIVMLENIVRHMEMGKSPMEAAFVGAGEVGFTILSMTLSLTAVFIPLLFLGGIVGRLFHEFAVVITVAILVSGFVSQTLTPMLASRFLRSHAGDQHGRMFTAIERFWERVIRLYARTLDWAMHHRRITMAFSLAILVGTVALYKVVPKGFLPSEDTGRVNGTTETAQGTSFDEMVRQQQAAAAIVAKDTNVSGFMSSIGGGGGANSLNQGRFFIGLKPHDSRVSADEFIRELRAKMAHLPGMQVFLSNPPPIQIGARTSKGLYQFTMQSGDLDVLYSSSQKLVAAARGSKLLQDVTSDLQLGNPQASIVIERERAASLGVTAQQIETALYNAYGSRQVSTIYAPNNEYWVVMELMPKYQTDLSALSLLHIRSSTGAMVPLSAVATVSQSVGAVSINHAGQLPAVTMSFDLPPGVSIGDAVAEVERFARESLPGTVTTAFTGTAQAFQDSQAGLLVLLGIAVFVIYVVLGILYESFIHPLTILSGLPFAAFGALLTLYVFHVDLSVYAFVGIILLVGLVKKNAIMMVDFAIEGEKSRGKSPSEAIMEASLVRFRPIMMTTMAALVGTLPIALATGAGSESRRPLGIAVVGGLAFSQVITLYVTPVVYVYMHRLNEFLSRRWARLKREPAVLPDPSGATSGHA